MSKTPKLPQAGGQYERDSNGNPVPRRAPKATAPAKAERKEKE